MDVFFDEIEVSHERLVCQENAYYPFGLEIKPLEREGEPDHRWLYNEMNERENVTGWDETKFRTYDYQTGRFNHVDPKAEMASQEVMTPYHYSFNNPIRYNDPNGDCPDCGKLILQAAVATKRWLDGNPVMSTKFEAKLTAGVQAGANVQVGGAKVGVNANLASVHIASVEHEQQKSDSGPDKTETQSIFDEEGDIKVEQGASIGLGIAAVGAEHSFILEGDGGYTDEKVKVEADVAIGHVEKKINLTEDSTSNRASFDVKIGAALLIGFELKVSFGLTDDKIKN